MSAAELLPRGGCSWLQFGAVIEISSVGTSRDTWRSDLWPEKLIPEVQQSEQNH